MGGGMTGRIPCLPAGQETSAAVAQGSGMPRSKHGKQTRVCFPWLAQERRRQSDAITWLFFLFSAWPWSGSLVWLIEVCERSSMQQSVRAGILAELTMPCHMKNCKSIVTGRPPQTERPPRFARRGGAMRACAVCVVRATLAAADVHCMPNWTVKSGQSDNRHCG